MHDREPDNSQATGRVGSVQQVCKRSQSQGRLHQGKERTTVQEWFQITKGWAAATLHCQERGAASSTQNSVTKSQERATARLVMVSAELLLRATTEGTPASAMTQSREEEEGEERGPG